jgi:hypothetical protein
MQSCLPGVNSSAFLIFMVHCMSALSSVLSLWFSFSSVLPGCLATPGHFCSVTAAHIGCMTTILNSLDTYAALAHPHCSLICFFLDLICFCLSPSRLVCHSSAGISFNSARGLGASGKPWIPGSLSFLILFGVRCWVLSCVLMPLLSLSRFCGTICLGSESTLLW